MELEVFQAFRKAGVDDATAQAAVESINRQIDKQFSRRASELFTKSDGAALELKFAALDTRFAALDTKFASFDTKLAELKAELIKWCVGAIFTSAGVYAAIFKLMH